MAVITGIPIAGSQELKGSSNAYLSPLPFQKLEETVERSPNPISPYDPNQHQHRKPLREKWTYSSGRFLFNEAQHLAERSIRFDVQALEKEVSKFMDHASVTATRVFLEGSKSRLLQMNLDDRRRVIVKIPYRPHPPHYATASEVATLTYVRSKGIPVPKIYGWSSDASKNKAGVEFIVMEKARGIAANIRFDDMEKSDIEQMVSGFVDVEKYLFALPFSAFGSIYFKDDVPQEHRKPLLKTQSSNSSKSADRYCIGPTTDPYFWCCKSSELSSHQGPWGTTSDYLTSVGHCALQWMSKQDERTGNKFPFNALFEDATNTLDQINLIKQYIAVAPLLLAETHKSVLHSAALRHPGLSSRNIFISRSIMAISCITNWRHATILPYAVAGGFPRAFDSPSSPQGSFRSPRVPPNFNTIHGNDIQPGGNRMYQWQLLHYTYRIKTALHNKTHTQVMDVLPVQLLQRVLHALRSPWTGVKNVVLLKGALMAISQNWRAFSTGVACPSNMTFDAVQFEGQAQDEELLDDAEELITYLKKEIGIYYDNDDRGESSDSNQGWIRHDRYEAASRRNRELKKEWLAQASNATEEKQIDSGWMFQDDEQPFDT